MAKIHHVIYTLYLICFILTIGLFLVAFWLFYPYPTITFNIPPTGAKVISKILYPGDTLKYEISFCKNTEGIATVHRTLIDGETHGLADITGSLPIGCENNRIISTTQIPDTLVPGEYHLYIKYEFHPNPFRYIEVSYQTENFTVVPKPVLLQAEINGVPATITVKSATTTASSI